jgi:hopanoid biosynthesis associated protein HpnK
MKNLIVTADDFGIAPSVNEGIARAHRGGIVSFVNLLPSGEAFSEAVSLSRELGILEAGAHLALSETRPVSGPSKIPTLVTGEGVFCRNYKEFLAKFFLGRVRRDEICAELKAQLAAAVNTGIPITCLSGHEHIHMVPEILKIFVDIAKEYRIPCIRCPQKDRPLKTPTIGSLYRKAVLRALGGGMKKTLDRSRILSTDYFAGFIDSGRLDEAALLEILKGLREGITELVTHPGFLAPEVLDRYRFHENCGRELAALTSVKVRRFVKESGISLVGFSALPLKR